MDLANAPSMPTTADTPVSAFYAANQLFRTVEASWQYRWNSPEAWEEFLIRAYKARFSPATVEEIRRRIFTDPTFGSMLSFSESSHRKLGQPVVQMDTTRLRNDRFLCLSGRRAGTEYEVMVVRHERDLISPTKTDCLSVVSHLTLNRHALERIYQRDGIRRRDELLPKIREELVRAERYVAFAFAAGLYVGLGPNAPGAVTCVPFGEGLLFVRNSIVAMESTTSPNSRYICNRGGTLEKHLGVNPDQTVPVGKIGNKNMTGYIIPVATTYISEQLMQNRIEQQAYHEGFLDAVEGYDLKAISLERCFGRLHHHVRAEQPTKVEIDPRRRLNFLLSQIAKRSDPREMWTTIGWKGDAAKYQALVDTSARKAA